MPSATAPSTPAPATAWSSPPTSRRASSPGRCAARRRPIRARVLATNLKVSGVPVFSAGDFEGEGAEPIVVRDEVTPGLSQAGGARRAPRRRRAGRRHARCALVCGADPLAAADRPDQARAGVRRGLRGGRVMGGQDFSDEQKRYLEGFVSGVQASRAAAGLKPLAGVGGGAEPAGPDAAHLRPWPASRPTARSSSPRRRPSATSTPSTPMRRLKAEAAAGQFPKGVDNFRWRFHGLFYAAPTQNAFMCRLRIPNGILTHWQLRRHRRRRRALWRRLCARDDARQPADPRGRGRERPAADRGAQRARRQPPGRRRRQHPQRHRLADRRHRSAGAAGHAALCQGLAPPHPQQPHALRPAAQVQRRLRRRRRHPRARGHQRHRLHGRHGRRRRCRWRPGVWFRLGLGGITGHQDFARPTGVLVQPEDAVAVADADRARLHRRRRPHRPQEGAAQIRAGRLGLREIPRTRWRRSSAGR